MFSGQRYMVGYGWLWGNKNSNTEGKRGMSRPTGTGTHDSLKKECLQGVASSSSICGCVGNLNWKFRIEIGNWRLATIPTYTVPVPCVLLLC